MLHAEGVDPVHRVGALRGLVELVDADGGDDGHEDEDDDEPAQDLVDEAEIGDGLRDPHETHNW